MRFCECVRFLQSTPVKSGDFGLEALQQRFQHEYFEEGPKEVYSAERYLFEASDPNWDKKTKLSDTIRNTLCLIVARDEYPTSFYTQELGWAIINCQGSIRDLLFSRFKQYADAKLALKRERSMGRVHNRQLITEKIKLRTTKSR